MQWIPVLSRTRGRHTGVRIQGHTYKWRSRKGWRECCLSKIQNSGNPLIIHYTLTSNSDASAYYIVTYSYRSSMDNWLPVLKQEKNNNTILACYIRRGEKNEQDCELLTIAANLILTDPTNLLQTTSIVHEWKNGCKVETMATIRVERELIRTGKYHSVYHDNEHTNLYCLNKCCMT